VAVDLLNDGFKAAVFQSLHVAPGQEFNEIVSVNANALDIAVGKALLSDEQDIDAVAVALKKDVYPELTNIIACHGNRRHPEFNKQLIAFAKNIEARCPNVFVCSVEGKPGIAKLKNAAGLSKETGTANFIPLMIVAGEHIMNDVTGDEADSWKNIVNAEKTICSKPLGYNDKVIDIYLKHLEQALVQVEN
jgi:sirohydrochlorin cobaltochelatase